MHTIRTSHRTFTNAVSEQNRVVNIQKAIAEVDKGEGIQAAAIKLSHTTQHDSYRQSKNGSKACSSKLFKNQRR